MGEPLVSAVIITYNQEKYIEQTIECALAQKVDFGYEIVIGEDCSTDRTREICLQYQKKYPDIIRVITSDRNVGLLNNWYRSVKAARGKYIAGCGGDDYWHNPEKIKKQTTFLEENQDYGLIHSDHDNFYQENGTIVKDFHLVNNIDCSNGSNDILHSLVSGKYWIMASTVLFRKELFEKYFNISEIKNNSFLMEDTPFYIEIAAHSKIYYLAESLTTYRILTNAVSQTSNKRKSLNFNKSNIEMCLYYCNKYQLPKEIKTHLEKNWRRITLKLAFMDKDHDLAETVRLRFTKLSLKELSWYYCIKFPIMRPLILFLKFLAQKF